SNVPNRSSRNHSPHFLPNGASASVYLLPIMRSAGTRSCMTLTSSAMMLPFSNRLDLCVEYLVYDTLQQLSHTLVSTKKLVQYLAIYGNLVLGHPLQPPVGFVDQLNHYREGDGPSYCYAILILEFTPSYRTLLLPWYRDVTAVGSEI